MKNKLFLFWKTHKWLLIHLLIGLMIDFTNHNFPIFHDLLETITKSNQEKPNRTLNDLIDVIEFDFCNDD